MALLLLIFTSLLLVLYFDTANIGSVSVVSTQESISDVVPEIIVDNLQVPWGVAFLPNGELLITERVSYPSNFYTEGKLVLIKKNLEREEIQIPHSTNTGDIFGLRDILLHPHFDDNKYIYLYITISSNKKNTAKVMRFTYNDGQLKNPYTVIDNIPGGPFQDGGRMTFGPDSMLYITSGDGADMLQAQDTSTLAGKILRLRDDGSIPEDNPFKNAVYTYGHRNPQGIVWDDSGNVWSSEHGPKEGEDEINLIFKGGNYGWPDSRGDTVMPGTIPPMLHSGNNSANTWAPGSLAYVEGYFLWGGLRSEAIYAGKQTKNGFIIQAQIFKNVYGRIRTVVLGPDDYVYFTTSNMDRRTDIRPNDDKLYRIHKDALLSLIQQ